jgi:predicted nucleic acid-binding protein
VFPDPAPVARAFAQVRGWLAAAPTWIPLPTDRHADVLETVLGSGGGNLVPDANLAALAIEHGLVLCSTDSDFARFPGLRWENPIAD